MADYTTEWQDQNELTNYPFSSQLFLTNILVDATFLQFNGFIPTLNTIYIEQASMVFNITFDAGTLPFTYNKSVYDSGITWLRLYDSSARYIGKLVFGTGLDYAWQNYVGQLINTNAQFVSSTVRSIGSYAGVFSFASLYDVVSLTRTAEDNAIFFNQGTDSTTGNSFLTINSVQNSQLPSPTPPQALLQLNLMSPLNNNIFIASSDVIQIQGNGIGGLNINLVGSPHGSQESPLANTLGF